MKSNPQNQTEAKFAQKQHKLEQFSEILANHHHWIAEPAIQREHATRIARYQRNHRLWIREEEGRSSKGFHRIRIKKEERESENALPVKIQNQGSKETVQILKQDSGNTKTPSYFTENHRISWSHVNP